MDKQKEKKKKVLMPFGLRNKLIAAISMLLVSSIMMVSSTYAWFTLSTAPEVKNISTTVAGNGSLEIALMPTTGNLGDIKAAAVGANASATATNTKWGNLVDLSDNSYGLADINLYPTALNVTATADADTKIYSSVFMTATADGTAIDPLAAPVSVPIYGGDGRIASISAQGIGLASANSDTGAIRFTGTDKGVRAIVEKVNAGGTETISAYGYVVDLALRLNTGKVSGTGATATVTDGKLLLQTAAAQRVNYGDTATNEDIMGGGSYMEFTSPTGSDLTDAQIRELMKSIRVTFVQNYGVAGAHTDAVTPDDGKQVKILGTAKLDVEAIAAGAPADGKYKANLYLYQDKDVTTGEGDAATTTKQSSKLEGNDAVLIEKMTKNAAKQISAIVWLDGATVKNADVAAHVASLNGKLNLQFTTDVTLVPAANEDVKGAPASTTP